MDEPCHAREDRWRVYFVNLITCRSHVMAGVELNRFTLRLLNTLVRLLLRSHAACLVLVQFFHFTITASATAILLVGFTCSSAC